MNPVGNQKARVGPKKETKTKAETDSVKIFPRKKGDSVVWSEQDAPIQPSKEKSVLSDKDPVSASYKKPIASVPVSGKTFDPVKIPPDFTDAVLHAKAKRILRLKDKFNEGGEELTDFCPCCNFPLEGMPFPISCANEELAELGEGFPLYYSLLKWIGLILLTALVVAGGYSFYRNYQAADIVDPGLKSNWILRGSLANYGYENSPTVLEPSLHVLAICLLLVLHTIVTTQHERMVDRMNAEVVEPSDYTLVFSNLPTVGFDKQHFQDFLEQSSRSDGKVCKISKINLVYHISHFMAACTALSRYKERLAEIKLMNAEGKQAWKKMCLCCRGVLETIEEYERLVMTQKPIVSDIETRIQENFTGIAFVTYTEDEDAGMAKRKFGKHKLIKDWKDFLTICFPRFSSWQAKKYLGKALVVKRAPDPSDILWENLGIDKWIVYRRRLLTAISTAIVLAIGAAGVYFSSEMKTFISDKYESIANPSSAQTFGYNVMSFLPSIIVVIINQILIATIWQFEKVSLYKTTTDMQAAVAFNLTLAMFINTALIEIPIHPNDWYGAHGLVVEIYNIMISNAVVAPILYLLSPAAIFKWFRVKRAVKQGERCMLTQQEANELHERLPVNMPGLCAGIMKTYLLTLMYAPILPIGLVIGLVAVLIQYWVCKYMLLRRHSRPIRLSDELDDVMLMFLPLGCAAYAATNFYFFYDLNTDAIYPGAVGCGIVLLYLITPLQRTIKLLLRRQMAVENLDTTPKSYEESAVDFFNDYDRANPVTSTEGNQWWIDLITKNKGKDAAELAGLLVNNDGHLKAYGKKKAPVAKIHKNLKRQQQGQTLPQEDGKSPVVPAALDTSQGPKLSVANVAWLKQKSKKPVRGAFDKVLSKAS